MAELRRLFRAIVTRGGPYEGRRAWLWNFRYRVAYGDYEEQRIDF